MDGFTPTSGVVVLTDKNHVDILDETLTQPGRFEFKVTVDKPDPQVSLYFVGMHIRVETKTCFDCFLFLPIRAGNIFL